MVQLESVDAMAGNKSGTNTVIVNKLNWVDGIILMCVTLNENGDSVCVIWSLIPEIDVIGWELD